MIPSRQILVLYARRFIAAALAYATVEIWCAEILRRYAVVAMFAATTRSFTVALLLVYVGIASVAGVAVAVLTNARAEHADRAAAITLVAIITVNLAVHFHLSVAPSLLMAVVLLTLCLAQSRRCSFLCGSWAIAALLLLPAWLANTYFESRSLALRSTSFAIAVVVTAGVCAAMAIAARRSTRVATTARMAAIALTIVAAFALRPATRPDMPQPQNSPQPAARNILLVTLDTVRADHLSLYGYARRTTPGLERLAQNATVYQRAISPANNTLGTHSSIFTGLYVSDHGAHYTDAHGIGAPLRSGFPTLAEFFRRRGYDVSSIAANPVALGTAFGLDRGFTHLFNELPPRPNASLDTLQARNTHLLRYPVWRFLASRARIFAFAPESVPANEITPRALARIDRARSIGRPFFLFVNYFDAHSPYRPPPPYASRFAPPDASVRSRDVSAYDGSIAFIDDEVVHLYEGLASRGLLDATVIVIASDHGEAFGEHGTWGHSTSVYDGQTFVPLLVLMPHQTKNVVREPVSLVDVFAFLKDGKPIGSSPAVAEAFPLSAPVENVRTLHAGRALSDGGYKLIRGIGDHPDELYDIREDPGEVRNVAQTQPEVHARLSAALDAWIAAHPVRKFDPPRALNDDMMRRLRALGYLQ